MTNWSHSDLPFSLVLYLKSLNSIILLNSNPSLLLYHLSNRKIETVSYILKGMRSQIAKTRYYTMFQIHNTTLFCSEMGPIVLPQCILLGKQPQTAKTGLIYRPKYTHPKIVNVPDRVIKTKINPQNWWLGYRMIDEANIKRKHIPDYHNTPWIENRLEFIIIKNFMNSYFISTGLLNFNTPNLTWNS